MAQVIPGVYDVLQKTVKANGSVQTNVNFIVGSADSGPIDEVVIGGVNTILNTYLSGDICDFVRRAALNGATNFKCVRVLAGSPLEASCEIDASASGVGTLKAKYKGAYGNSISFQIEDGSIDSTKKFTFRYKTHTLGYIDNATDGESIVSLLEDHPVLKNWVTYTNTTETLPDNVDTWTSFANGTDGNTITNTEIVGTYNSATGARTGLQLAVTDTNWHNIATATLEGDDTVNAGLIAVCETRGQIGKGKAFCTHDSSDSVSTIKSSAVALKNSSYRHSYWTGWYKSSVDPDTYVSPVAGVMGIVSSVPVFESCGNLPLKDVVSFSNEYDRAQIEDLLGSLVNVATKSIDGGSANKTYHSLLNTTHTDITEIQEVGTLDYCAEKMVQVISNMASRPNKLRTARGVRLIDKLQATGNRVMSMFLRQETKWGPGIIDGGFVICDDTNNTSETAEAKQLIFEWAIRFINAAHYINNKITVTNGDLSTITIEETIV
jgi:hypothetical protein